MKRKGKAQWQGTIKEGKGQLSSDSGALHETPYSFRSRFEQGGETNPEELIAAAHAGCFSMALAKMLGDEGLTVSRIDTEATVTLESHDGGFAITAVHLDVNAIVPGATAEQFEQAASQAKSGCPVSKVLNAEINMTTHLQDIA